MPCRRIWPASIASALLMLAGTAAITAADPTTKPISPETQVAIDQNSEMAIEGFSKLTEQAFDYSEQSIAWIDGFIERHRTDHPERMVDVIGSYLGNAIVKNHGGRWVNVGDAVGVELEGGIVAFPMAKVEKQFANGAADSVLAFYRAVPVLIREQKAKQGR